jgi:hypothetical protein
VGTMPFELAHALGLAWTLVVLGVVSPQFVA